MSLSSLIRSQLWPESNCCSAAAGAILKEPTLGNGDVMKPYPLQTLIAEDSDDERLLLNRALRAVPYVRVAAFVHDGVEAIEYLQGTGQFGDRRVFPFPELLLLDCWMPRCSGIEVLEFLQYRHPRPRVVLWSSTPQLLDEKLAGELGADMVCEKPLEPVALMRVMHRIVSRGSKSARIMTDEPYFANPVAGFGEPCSRARHGHRMKRE